MENWVRQVRVTLGRCGLNNGRAEARLGVQIGSVSTTEAKLSMGYSFMLLAGASKPKKSRNDYLPSA